MAAAPETVGFIDVGTNSVHLSVVRYYEGTSGTVIHQDKEMIRIGCSLYSGGLLGPETIAHTAETVSRFSSVSRGMDAGRVIAVATCAAREAPDSAELAAALSEFAEVRVIPGAEEARLIALGVFGPEGPAEKSLLIDIGGGSTEIVIGEGRRNLFIDSLSMGTVRFAYSLGLDLSGPVSLEDYHQILRSVDLGSYHSCGKVRDIGFSKAYGSSGTMIALASACAEMRGDSDSSYMELDELRALMSRLLSADADERTVFKGIGRARSDIIIAGGAIAEELMFLFGINRIEITTKGLREGMQMDLFLSRGHMGFDARRDSVMSLAYRCHCNLKHSETVERYALEIFDRTKELRLHSMPEEMRNLLSCAAILHDIGEIVNYENHNVLSQMMIEHSDMVGFDITELRAMGLMARFHHRKFPGPKDRPLRNLPESISEDVRRCAMFLRLGDVIDRRREYNSGALRIEKNGDSLVLMFSCEGSPSAELYRIDKIRDEFRKMFGCDISVIPLSGS